MINNTIAYSEKILKYAPLLKSIDFELNTAWPNRLNINDFTLAGTLYISKFEIKTTFSDLNYYVTYLTAMLHNMLRTQQKRIEIRIANHDIDIGKLELETLINTCNIAKESALKKIKMNL